MILDEILDSFEASFSKLTGNLDLQAFFQFKQSKCSRTGDRDEMNRGAGTNSI